MDSFDLRNKLISYINALFDEYDNYELPVDELPVRTPPPKAEFDIICSSCKQHGKVPFKPDPSRPVLCPTCFKNNKR